MMVLPPDGNVAKTAPLGARIANRLARHLGTASAALAPVTPLVSFTFDDAPDCACTRGAETLAAAGATGTFYISGGMIASQARYWRLADADMLAALHAQGHEIGCHTHSHRFLPDLTGDAIEAELRTNQARLEAIVPDLRLQNFAYPFGYGSLTAKRALRGRFATSRSVLPGLNVGRVDRHYLRANPLIDGAMDPGRIAALMDAALAANGWLIFYGHDVTPSPSPYGCSPALLDAALRAAAERKIPCVSVAEGLRRALRTPARSGRARASFAS